MSDRRPGPPVDPAPVCGECSSTPCACNPGETYVLDDVGDLFVRVRPTVVVHEDAEGVSILHAWYTDGTLSADEKAQIDRGRIEKALEAAKAAEAAEMATEPGAMTTAQIEAALLLEPHRATRQALDAARRRKAAETMSRAYCAAGRDDDAEAVEETCHDQEILQLLSWHPRYRKDLLRAFSDQEAAEASIARLLRAGTIAETRDGDDPVLSLPRGGGHA